MCYKYQSQEADNTFITSDGTSPYNSTRKWAVKRHYRENNHYNPHENVKHEEVIRVLRHTELLQVTLSTGKIGYRTEPLLNVLGNKVWVFLYKN